MEQKYPEPTIGALIFNPEGKILLINRRDVETCKGFKPKRSK
jgi:hypothetical protein